MIFLIFKISILLNLFSSIRSNDLMRSAVDVMSEGYIQQADETYEKVRNLILSDERKLTLETEDADLIFSMPQENTGTAYIAEFYIPISPVILFFNFWFEAADTPKWNPNVESIETILEINKTIRILYQKVSNPQNSWIPMRDFVDLASYRCINETYYITLESIQYDDISVPQGYLRGWNGPSGLIIKPIESGSLVTWIFNTDMKMNGFFKVIMDQLFPSQIETLVGLLKTYIKDQKRQDDEIKLRNFEPRKSILA